MTKAKKVNMSASVMFSNIKVPTLKQESGDELSVPTLVELALMLKGTQGTLADVCESYNGNRYTQHKLNASFSGDDKARIRDAMGFSIVQVTKNKQNEKRPGAVWTVDQNKFDAFIVRYNAWYDNVGISHKSQYGTYGSIKKMF